MKAVCTWGEGPDVLLTLEGTPLLLEEAPSQKDKFKYGIITKGDLDLSAEDAYKLGLELINGAMQAYKLCIGCNKSALKESDKS